MFRHVIAVLLLASGLAAQQVTTCEQQSSDVPPPSNITWVGYVQHTCTGCSGSHQVTYQWVNSCNYTTVTRQNGAPCATNELTYANQPPGTPYQVETGVIADLPSYHAFFPASQQASAQNPSGGTSVTGVEATTQMVDCDPAVGCPKISITFGPLHVSGGSPFDGGVFTDNASCPKATYIISGNGGCGGGGGGGQRQIAVGPVGESGSYPAQGCGSPLGMEIAGLGPFSGDKNVDYTNLDQFTGPEVPFKLKRTGPDWAGTPIQMIGWSKPGSHWGWLVLLDKDGRIETSDQLFGNWTTCKDGERCHDGFAALKWKCDARENGGNEDGVCDAKDRLWSKLRWLVGRPDSPDRVLVTMKQVGLQSISLTEYRELAPDQQMHDHNGNTIRYQGVADFGWKPSGTGMETDRRPVYDMWLVDYEHRR